MKPSAEFLIDRRLVERHLEKGHLAPEDFQKFLDSLPDAGLNSGVTSIPVVKVSARKSVVPKVSASLPADELEFDDDDDDDGDVD